ncbi:hemolysin E, partial [Streptococcus pneumoniae]
LPPCLTRLNKRIKISSQVDKIRKEAYAGAAAGVVAGPFGLIISYSIAAGVVEGKLIPELKNKLKSVQSFFTTLSNTVKQANKDIVTGR